VSRSNPQKRLRRDLFSCMVIGKQMKRKLYYTQIPWERGTLSIFSSDRGICGIALLKGRHGDLHGSLQRISQDPPVTDEKRLRPAVRELIRFLAGKSRRIRLPVDLAHVTPFQQRVYRVLRKIPYGSVRSYQWVAESIGNPKACRAVGSACARNPVPLLIPCHRVIAANGSLGGFSAGPGIKQWLLELEKTRSETASNEKP